MPFIAGGKGETPVIAIDHKPTLAKVTFSDINEVVFKVPVDAIGSATEETTIWISVVVDGRAWKQMHFLSEWFRRNSQKGSDLLSTVVPLPI